MERCDFASVITTIRKYISEDRGMNQIDLLYELFASFICDENNRDYDFDNGSVCRWFNGIAKISPAITKYYLDKENRKQLLSDIEENIIPIMYDSALAVKELHNLLVWDMSVSDETKKKLTKHFPCKTEQDKAALIGSILCFAMERNFVKRKGNTKQLPSGYDLSPIVKDRIFGADLPPLCKYFCGRDKELLDLHKLICEHGKLFVQGIAGIGKSELAKAYAKRYRKEYTNIIYFTYSGCLKKDIAEVDFADDYDSSESVDDRFRKHNRFLRSLKSDTLIIIDGFDTVASDEELLSAILKYHCRIIFTTRCRYEDFPEYTVEELSETLLLEIMENIYSDAESCQEVLCGIIHTVYSHTFAVELSARLLEIGLLTPPELLQKLQTERASMSDTEKVGIKKDGKIKKATYYNHIHTLFSLYRLSTDENEIMKHLTLMPSNGVSARSFAKWIMLENLNPVNDLIEKGFIKTAPGRTLSLHPMLCEVAFDDTKPSVTNCSVLLKNLQNICLRHGEDTPNYRKLFEVIISVADKIKDDDSNAFLRFMEDVFPYMEKYNCKSEMKIVIEKIAHLLSNKTTGNNNDRALLLDYHAAMETRINKAALIESRAVALLGEITEENALLAANLNANLGGYYRELGKVEQARECMEKAVKIIEDYGLAYYHDTAAIITNYAMLLTDTGHAETALSALKKLSNTMNLFDSEKSLDRAVIFEAMGNACAALGDYAQAASCYKKSLEIYETVFGSDTDKLEVKKKELSVLRIGV